MKPHMLERLQTVPRPREEVFAFFAEPRNLERITPAFLDFHILTPTPLRIAEGTQIDYRLRLFGVPFRWRSRIRSYLPLFGFVDVQERGPYRSWEHLHEFQEVPGGTQIRDLVEYRVAFPPVGWCANALLVRRTLDRIFDHRERSIAAILGLSAPGRASDRIA